MRANLPVFLAVVTTAAVIRAFSGCSTSGDEVRRTGTELDCVWVNDEENCWRTMLIAIDDCLGHPDGGINIGVGALAPDRKSCTYPGGREIVAASVPLDLLGPGGDPKSRDFEVRLGGRLCAKVVQSGDSVTVTGPNGTVRYERRDDNLSLTCPDGRTLTGTTLGLIQCLAPQLGVPGYAWQAADASTYFTLLGMRAPLFSCQVPADAAAPLPEAALAIDAAEDAADGG